MAPNAVPIAFSLRPVCNYRLPDFRLLVCMLLWCLANGAQAQQTLIANVPLLTSPGQEEKIEPYYIDIINAVDKELSEVEITTQIRPFPRSLREVSQGISDLHIPALCVPSPVIEEYLVFSEEKVGLVYFVLFSQANKPITRELLEQTPYQLTPTAITSLADQTAPDELDLIAQLTGVYATKNTFIEAVEAKLARQLSEEEKLQFARAAYPYHIETERFQMYMVDFPAHPASSISSSLHRLLSGRVDAIIYPIMSIAPRIAKEKLDAQIHSSLFKAYDVCYLVAKSEHGQAIMQTVDKALRRLKEKGMFVTFLNEGFEAQESWAHRYLDGWTPRSITHTLIQKNTQPATPTQQ